MIDKIKLFKKKVEEVKETHPLAEKIDKGGFCKLLVMANLAEMSIYSSVKIRECEKDYFDRQSTVGRYYSDWGLDWIAIEYLEIATYLRVNNLI